jgi:hypothetical protein
MFKSILAGTILAVTLPVTASEIKITQFESRCAGWDLMLETLKRFQELPLTSMVSHREIGGQPRDLDAVLFANSRTGTWTLVEQVGPDLFCITGMGDSVRPFDPKEKSS